MFNLKADQFCIVAVVSMPASETGKQTH